MPDASDVETAGTGNVPAIRPYQRFIRDLQRRAEAETAGNSENVTARMIDQIMQAAAEGTEQDIWDADEAVMFGLQDLEGAELEIKDFVVLKSTDASMQTMLGVYIIGEATLLADFGERNLTTGETIVFNTGAPGVIAKLRAFEAKQLMPVRTLIKGVKASNGTVLKLRPIPNRAVQG